MKNQQQYIEVPQSFFQPQIKVTNTQQDTQPYSDCVLQVLELEILFRSQQPNLLRKLLLKFSQDGKKQYYNLRLIKQDKTISRYVLIDQEPFNLNRNSINDLTLDICSFEQKTEESWDNMQLFKLLQESANDVALNQGKDCWLFRYLNDPLDREIYHYGFLHIVIYKKQDCSYFDYLQNMIKDDIFLKCPLYRENVYFPYFQPQQILLVYKLLSEFNYEWNFQGFYKYQVIENDYNRILHQDNEIINIKNQKSFSEYYANIRTFYQFMYVSQITKLMTYYYKIQIYFWQNFQQSFKDSDEKSRMDQLQDMQKISEKIGISIKYRFQTWNLFAMLSEKVGQQFSQLVQNYPKIEFLTEYKKLKETLQEIYGDQYESQSEKYIQENKEILYNIISIICHFHCIHVTPQMLYDLNKRFEQDLIDSNRLSERFNQIAQVIKDIIFIYTFNQEEKYQSDYQSQQHNSISNNQSIQVGEYEELQKIAQINYHQGLIDIIDKLITLNQSCKSNQDQKEPMFLSNVFWTVYSIYNHVLKYYISSKYRGKHIVDDLFLLNYCLKLHIKDLWDHLDYLHINTDFLFEKSFFSVYSNILSRELLYRIWDIIFLEISRDKIKPRWILIAIAMTILFKLKNTLKEAKTIDDVLLLINTYCSYETNIYEFISSIYEWIDKLFSQKIFENDYQTEEYYESQKYQDEHLIEKLLIQESVMKGFYSKFSVFNNLFEDQYLSKLRHICFSKYFQMYEKLKSEYQVTF